jgi:5-methylcytosine-specific restriction endonuclease McrA
MCSKNPFWANKNKDKWDQLQFNTEFLKKVESECGELRCEYCGKENLKIYEWCHKTNLSDVATADHFYPKSKYPNIKQNEYNLVVSCYTCNDKKRDGIWLLDEIKFPLKNTKILEIKSLNHYL